MDHMSISDLTRQATTFGPRTLRTTSMTSLTDPSIQLSSPLVTANSLYEASPLQS